MISLLEAAIGRTFAEALSGAAWSAKAFFLMEAMGRSLLLGLAVWAGLQVLGIRAVVAQKAAWVLVLLSALLMPGILPVSAALGWLPRQAMVVIPAREIQTLRTAPQETLPAEGMAGPAREEADGARVAAGSTASTASERQTAQGEMAEGRETTSLPPVREEAAPPTGWTVSGWALAGLGYCLVSVLLVMRLLWGMMAALRLWMGAEGAEMGEELLPEGRVRVRWSAEVDSPVTVGSGIVLPADYESWDAEKLRIVLAHEQSHVRQGDFYLQALAGLYTALFWVSPLGWWLRRRLSDLGEAISDRAGLSRAASNTSYARILLQFAAIPHRAEIGVAMARRGVLTQRIERLLNEHSFRQAFAGGRVRVAAAVLLVPAALFGATALIRVEAKGGEAANGWQEQGQAHPESAVEAVPASEPTEAVEAQEAVTPAVSAETTSEPAVAPAPPAAPRGISAEIQAPQPPETPVIARRGTLAMTAAQDNLEVRMEQQDAAGGSTTSEHSYSASGKGYRYAYSSNGDSYALVKGNDAGRDSIRFSGEWMDGRKGELEKARRMTHGDFLWFTRNGKSYVVDDPAVIAQVEATYKPMEDLGRQQEELGKQQEALGRQQEELASKQSEARVPAPDLTKEMAVLNQEMKQLESLKGGTVTQEQLAELQGKLGDLQGRLGELQGQVASKQGDLGEAQGRLGEQQGKLGAQQGRLGAEQGRLAREADRKVKSIMDQSLKDGKAKPVQ